MLSQKSDGCFLCDESGATVGKLSGEFKPPSAMRCIDARVASIHVRRIKDVGEEYRAGIHEQNEAWEMIVPELVFAPGEQADQTHPALR
jgi:hypothetical protein